MSSQSLELILRESAPQVVGALTRRYGDFGLAEDATQEAFVAAFEQWPNDGVPENPSKWLVRVASRRLVDRLRNESARRQREDAVVVDDGSIAFDQDDSLTVLFLCCSPALSTTSAVALTLRAVGGLTTEQIAKAYFVPEATMAQRISRAKQRVRDAITPLADETAERQPRITRVLNVLYLIFNEGYTASSGDELDRPDLAAEAIRLTRWLDRLMPDQPEIMGLLALMLLTDARRPARLSNEGDLIPLPEQDRALWDAALIAEGLELVQRALPMGAVGQYQLQAAVAALHDEAESVGDTDWAQIDALYAVLERMTSNAMVTLNRAVAVAMTAGPAAAHSLLDAIASNPQLARSHRLDAVRAHLFEMSGDLDRAVIHYRAAAAKTTSAPEQRYLLKRAAVAR